jgi:hypothetical protein
MIRKAILKLILKKTVLYQMIAKICGHDTDLVTFTNIKFRLSIMKIYKRINS